MLKYKLKTKILATVSTISLLTLAPELASAITHETSSGGTSTFSGTNITNGAMEDGHTINFAGSSHAIADIPLNKVLVNAKNNIDNTLVVNANTNFAAINNHTEDNKTNLVINSGVTVTLAGNNTDMFNGLGKINGVSEGKGILHINSTDPVYGDIGQEKRLERVIIDSNTMYKYSFHGEDVYFHNEVPDFVREDVNFKLKSFESMAPNIFSQNIRAEVLDLNSPDAELQIKENARIAVDTIEVGGQGSQQTSATLFGAKNSYVTGDIIFKSSNKELILGLPLYEGDIFLEARSNLTLDVMSDTNHMDTMTINGHINSLDRSNITVGDSDGNSSSYIIEGNVGKDYLIQNLVIMSANTDLTVKGNFFNIDKLDFATAGGRLVLSPTYKPEEDSSEAFYNINTTGVRRGNVEISGDLDLTITGDRSLGSLRPTYNSEDAYLDNLKLSSANNNKVSFNLPVYANKLDIAKSGNHYNFNKGLFSDEINLNANDTFFQFTSPPTESYNFTAKVRAGAPDIGTLEFYSPNYTFIESSLGSRENHLKSVSLQGKGYRIADNIFARTVKMTDTYLSLKESITIGIKDGQVDFSSSTVNVREHTLTIPANITFSPTSTLYYTFDGTSNGLIDNSEASSVQIPDGVSISIRNKAIPDFTVGQELILYKANSNPSIGNITITDLDGAASFSSRVENGSIIAHVDNVIPITRRLHEERMARLEFNNLRFNDQEPPHNDLEQFLAEYRQQRAYEVKYPPLEKVTKLTPQISAPLATTISSAATQTVQAALGNSASVVANRMMNISTPEIETDTPDIQAKRTTGGAAGTLAEQDEIWFSGFASNATQKLRAGDAGYKATTMGGAVGYDLNVNDDLILGAALTYSDTGIDQADHKTGDKVEAQTYMLGFYGLYDLTEHIFIQGLLNIGRTTVATDSNRVIYGRNYVAHGEYDIANYGFAVVTGYNYAYGHYLFTPTIGLQQNLFSEDGYTETGAGSQNLKVLVKNYNKFTGNIGLKVSTPVQIDQYRLTPSFNFALNHDFNNEGVKVKQMFVGTTNIITTESAKPATTSYTAGAGLSLKVSNVDIDVNYNIEVKSKFVGHQGSFKLRINL